MLVKCSITLKKIQLHLSPERVLLHFAETGHINEELILENLVDSVITKKNWTRSEINL